ncbi:MAG TPA: glycosyltransferase [Candidatus Binatia bacterium]|nr:glycosyltransferase [Candidatus Binatia bacterium]
MRIMFVSNLYGDLARGGAERVVAQEAGALAAAGHDVVVVSGEPKREIPKGVCLPAEPWLCPPAGGPGDVAAAYAAAVSRAKMPGVPRTIRYHAPNFYFYPEGGKHGYATRLLWHLRDIFNDASAATLRRIIELERPDVVHTHNLMGLGFRIPAMLRRMRVLHVHTVHDVQLLHPSGLLPPSGRVAGPARVPQAAYAALMRRMMGSPDVVFFPSEFLRDAHARAGFFRGSRAEVLRNPTPDISLAARAVPSSPTFLFAGQLEEHKGIRFLLDVWRRWDDRGAAILEIAGDGSLAEEVARTAASLPGVTVLGKLDRDALFAAYARVAYLVYPSLVIENAPAAIMESLSRGTPVVAAATGGVPELVTEGGTGFLFPPGDADAFLAKLRLAAAQLNPPNWISFYERCMRAAQGTSISKHAERLMEAYRAQS